jgi:predicted esterase
LLADIAFEGIDQILQQAMTFGREENFFHIQCTRVGNELMVLSDSDPRYEWILPAVKKRLREELACLHYDLAALETQSLDVTGSEALRFLDYELYCVKGRRGVLQVQYRRVVTKPRRRKPKKVASPHRPLPFVQPCLNWIGRRRSWQLLREGYRKANAYQASWRHLPITLFPVLAIMFGWRSPVMWVCLALIFVCNWRLALHSARSAGTWTGRRIVYGGFRKISSIQVGWRHLPITLFPVLGYLYGWRSSLVWLCLALIFVCNWRWTWSITRSVGTWAWRRKLDVVLGACALTALICVVPFVSDAYANRPREVAVASSLPPGFYMGEHHGDLWWYGGPAPGMNYGLYVPPHLHKRKGPYPLIVFLHGYGKRTKKDVLTGELPVAIAEQFAPNGSNGPFDFVAFFPVDPTARWQAGSTEVDNVMMALDYVVAHHQIDPSRVYLTGISSGGSGVWNLAEAYPNKWAAVAPVCSFTSPDTAKVRRLPAWIFHGANDPEAPVERERTLVKQLKEAGADVHYTEFPNKGHYIGAEAYSPKGLYQWLASKKKD